MRLRHAIAGLAVATLFAGSIARASDTAQELADLKSKIAMLESRMLAPAGNGDAESLMSLNRGGAVRIGGEVELDLIFGEMDEAGEDSDEWDRTQFNTANMNLDIRVDTPHPGAYLVVKFDMDDLYDGDGAEDGQSDDILEEVRFVWEHVRSTNWNVLLGKGEMPFGQDKDVLVTNSYTHNDSVNQNDGVSSWAALSSGNNSWYEQYAPNGGGTNIHGGATATPFSHPGEIDNVFGVEVEYFYRELALLEFAVFQNNDLNPLGDRRGMAGDRAEDHFGLQSFAMRGTFYPMGYNKQRPPLTLMVSFAKQHMESQGDETSAFVYTYPNGAVSNPVDQEKDKSALSLAFDYHAAGVPIEVFGEYIHGWNWLYSNDISTDTLQLGYVWEAAENMDVIGMFEWLGIENNTAATDLDEDLYKLALGVKYEMPSGIYFLLEYMHEWYDNDIDGWDETETDVLSFRTAYTF